MKLECGIGFDLATKSLSTEGTFEGYASVFDKVDLGDDIVRPGAFAKSLAVRPAAKVKMLRSHDREEPIGMWTALAEDSRGLHVKGRLIRETVKGAETYALMREGVMDGLSIGFLTIKESFDRPKGIRYLEEIDLREISIVTFPMLPDALVSTVKHDQPERARAVVAALQRATLALRS